MLNDTAVTAAIQIEITIMRGGLSFPRAALPSASIAPSHGKKKARYGSGPKSIPFEENRGDR